MLKDEKYSSQSEFSELNVNGEWTNISRFCFQGLCYSWHKSKFWLFNRYFIKNAER